MKNSPPFVGQKIKAARKAKGLTLTQVGDLIGVTNQALSAIERGKARPSRQTLKSLGRVLDANFGERKLLVKMRPPKLDDWDEFEERIIREEAEAYEASQLPKPVRRIKLTGVQVPVHYVILNSSKLSSFEGNDYVLVPAVMVPVLKAARAVRILVESAPEAFADHGDAIILTDCSDSMDNKIVLVEIGGNVFLRRWSDKGSRVTLSALDQKIEPINLPSKKIKCIGEVTGMLKIIRASPTPILVCGVWPS